MSLLPLRMMTAVASGPDVCYGMVGCLGLVVLVKVTLGLLLLGI